MENIITNLVLNTYRSDVNVSGYNSDTKYQSINFKNLLGDDYELNADYTLILYNVTINEFTLASSRRCGTIRIYGGGAMLFNNRENLDNSAIYMFTLASGGPLSTNYNYMMCNQFKLTRETGNIRMTYCNQLSNIAATSSSAGLLTFFTIRKIKYELYKPLNTNSNTNILVLNSYNFSSNTNNVIVQWDNINFVNLLGDNYELNATYNLVLMSVCFNNTAVSSTNRSGYLSLESNALKLKYSNNNKWLIPFSYTNTQPNTQTLRGSSTNTFVLTSETGYIKTNHYIQHTNLLGSTFIPYKTLYFRIYKL